MASDADEVAEDYRHALEDLSSNMRFEISNLTVIARENTEHALAIAEVLQQHILKAPPNKKLPALYVLDSIVKNVGTPYTLYFGRNLFKTFMEAYAVVDHNIRRKMEEMLKTWKDPVPGSMDTRPVFSHELVRPIEHALMKARAATMPQQSSIPGRPRSALMPNRNTPTPPGIRPSPAAPPGAYPSAQYPPYPNGGHGGEQVTSGLNPYLGQQHLPRHSSPQQMMTTTVPFQQTFAGPYGAAMAATAPTGISVDTLSSDIQNLIVAMKAEFSQKPHDASVQNRLKALLDLQGVVQYTSLPADQLELIKNKVTELAAVNMRPSSAQGSLQGLTANVPLQLQHQQGHAAPSLISPLVARGPTAAAAVSASGSSNQTPLTIDSLLGPGAMAALMARQSSASQKPISTPSHVMTATKSPQPAQTELSGSQPRRGAEALLERLRLAGMLPPAAANAVTKAAVAAPPGVPPAAPLPALPSNIASLITSCQSQIRQSKVDTAMTAMPINTNVLKQGLQPRAVIALYDGLGPPCTQCGRRFKTDGEGKKKKMAHMDWHFRVHQRSSEAEKKGTHRSWYVDEKDWLKSREVVDSDHIAAPEEESALESDAEHKVQYIAVPDAGKSINNVCPICQEKFENKWLDTAQEWVWLDVVLVGNRAYHASCHTEATRDRDGTPIASRLTPEPILGKRKAEVSLASPKIRAMKTAT
ncbi:hypothetical protein CDD81_6271 [Ophiocordyceps australis]|uniref:CID domain-containing protein n=1 Tax=Ophiocordyceps australis TaxID=1399860 RepID=A0A2C5Y6R3_9HYPO|nr:hypothetical protein CDD81_6271 [Ophiocordyceps australis]